VLAAIVMLCGIGLALYGLVALGELAVQRRMRVQACASAGDRVDARARELSR
jgi:hypothetical protein